MKKLFRVGISVLLSAGSALMVLAQTTTTPLMSDRAAARFLDQATWGPTPASIAQLEQMGITPWLAQQFSLNTSDLPDQALLNSVGNTNQNLAPVQLAFFENTVTGSDQLRQRVAFALSQIWVVSQVQVTNAYAYPPYWRLFRDNAFGNYRDIIKAVTLNPAMGSYLSMANNNKANVAKGTSPNENYARELMQLFTLGLTQLNMDGSPVVGSNGPVPTYTQTDVDNNAKLLTGWTYPTAPGATAKTNNPAYYFGQMFAVAAEHDLTAKTVLGVHLPACQTATQDLTQFIEILMNQPTMAPFVSQQLIQHLVTSNPSPAYIERVAQVFQNNGSNVNGDMQAVITAILTDPEARAADAVAPGITSGHLREPILFMADILRGLNATLTATSAVYNDATSMGQNLFNPGSLFSYFSPQYRIQGGLLGPEFQIYSTQTVATRADIVNSAIFGKLDGGTTVNLAPFVAAAGNGSVSLLQYISYVFLHSSMSQALELQATDAVNAVTTPTTKAQAALYVVLTSGEYQIVQ
jgi:uncharacterized protein (DUF1800 family)